MLHRVKYARAETRTKVLATGNTWTLNVHLDNLCVRSEMHMLMGHQPSHRHLINAIRL